MKVNPYTLQTEVIDLPEGIYGPANSWYAWTPDCFCASQQQNVLYWNGGVVGGLSGGGRSFLLLAAAGGKAEYHDHGHGKACELLFHLSFLL